MSTPPGRPQLISSQIFRDIDAQAASPAKVAAIVRDYLGIDADVLGETGDPFEAFNVSAAKRIATRRQKVKGTVLVLEKLDGSRPRLVATKDAHGIWTDTAETG